jgi:hypothetical protein
MNNELLDKICRAFVFSGAGKRVQPIRENSARDNQDGERHLDCTARQGG